MTRDKKKYVFKKSDKSERTSEQMVEFWDNWVKKYPIVSLEDGLAEDDWDGWKLATQKLGKKIQLVGDDVFVTNPKIFARGISEGIANAILIKLNQIGSVTETIEAVEMARKANYAAIVSHRSGETEDTFLADFVVAMGCGPNQDRLRLPHRPHRQIQPASPHRRSPRPRRPIPRSQSPSRLAH